jgi:RNA polymerase sigma-70 factor (ECF subfamily)
MATVRIDAANIEQHVKRPGITLLDFWAEWCGPCRSFGPIFERASEQNSDAVFGKIDTEDQRELAAAFGIASIPTLMVFRDGLLLFRQAGALPELALNTLLDEVRAIDNGRAAAGDRGRGFAAVGRIGRVIDRGPVKETDERAEWRRAQGGDRAAIDLLLRRHQRQIYRFGLRMCGDEEAAREVLQRTLLTAFEQLSSFRGEARLSTWLYSLARSQCSRLHRRTRSAPAHDVSLDEPMGAPELPSEGPEQDLTASQQEMARLVTTAIALLPPGQREAVVLKDVEDLPLEEAARTVQLAVPAFKSRLHRAREQLKQNLAALMQDQPATSAITACPELQATLQAVRGSSVDRAVCTAIESHLKSCARCREEMGPLQDAAALCRRLPGGDVPEAVQRAVRTALLRATRG